LHIRSDELAQSNI